MNVNTPSIDAALSRNWLRAPNSELFTPPMRAFQVQIKDGARVRMDFPACGESKVAVQQAHECLADASAGEQCIVLTASEYAARRYAERLAAASPFKLDDSADRQTGQQRREALERSALRKQQRLEDAANWVEGVR